MSDEQTDQVELIRPPSAADFQGFPDAPTLHRLRQVSGLHVTDDTDPAQIPTNTGRSAADLPVIKACFNMKMKQRNQLVIDLFYEIRIVTLSSSTVPPCCTASRRPINFDGSLFSGKAILWTKGVPSQPKHLFKGQRRKSSITIQGRFKRPVVMSHLVTGPEFTRPFVNLPAKWFVEGVLLRVSRACTF